MLRRTALLVVAVLLTAGLPPARADWMEPLPEGASPNFSWERMTGYWARRGAKNYMMYISREGMLHSVWHADGDISSYVGRWKPVRELVNKPPDDLANLVMATDEKFCSDQGSKPSPHFRVLGLYVFNGREFLNNDFALHVMPLANPLHVPAEDLWRLLRVNPDDAMYKDEGAWFQIDEAAAPDWFKDQVRRLVHSGRFDCEPVLQTK